MASIPRRPPEERASDEDEGLEPPPPPSADSRSSSSPPASRRASSTSALRPSACWARTARPSRCSWATIRSRSSAPSTGAPTRTQRRGSWAGSAFATWFQAAATGRPRSRWKCSRRPRSAFAPRRASADRRLGPGHRADHAGRHLAPPQGVPRAHLRRGRPGAVQPVRAGVRHRRHDPQRLRGRRQPAGRARLAAPARTGERRSARAGACGRGPDRLARSDRRLPACQRSHVHASRCCSTSGRRVSRRSWSRRSSSPWRLRRRCSMRWSSSNDEDVVLKYSPFKFARRVAMGTPHRHRKAGLRRVRPP